jgi:hypothetical protein
LDGGGVLVDLGDGLAVDGDFGDAAVGGLLVNVFDRGAFERVRHRGAGFVGEAEVAVDRFREVRQMGPAGAEFQVGPVRGRVCRETEQGEAAAGGDWEDAVQQTVGGGVAGFAVRGGDQLFDAEFAAFGVIVGGGCEVV